MAVATKGGSGRGCFTFEIGYVWCATMFYTRAFYVIYFICIDDVEGDATVIILKCSYDKLIVLWINNHVLKWRNCFNKLRTLFNLGQSR